jgi:Uma2 family endonuclease
MLRAARGVTMPEPLMQLPYDLRALTATLVTEDDTPVDNLFSAKQRRLLVEPLYSSWQPLPLEDSTEPRIFLADSDVGVFISPYQPPVAPDMFLSLDVAPNPAYIANEHRSYFTWEYGKPPEVAVEIVSNRKGKEMDDKMRQYARIGVSYYIVFDPFDVFHGQTLMVHELTFGGRRYHRRADFLLPEIGLSLQLWHGEFEGMTTDWLRWCDAEGVLIPTGEERAYAEADRANAEADRANAEAAARQAAEAELEKVRSELQRLQSQLKT